MLNKIINYLARKPLVLDFSRRFLEGNHQGERQVMAQELPERQRERVLDLGCGTGVFAPFFGSGYLGVDISPRYIAYARQKYPDRHFQVMDGGRLAITDGTIDAIWVNGVFHHLDDKASQMILREMRRVLKKSGRAVVLENIFNGTWQSKIIAKFDIGEFVRWPSQYRQLWQENFSIQKDYPVRFGICDYQVFVLTPK